MAQIVLSEGTAPATPSTGTVTVYAKTDGKVYAKDDAGTESDLSAGLTDGDKGDITVASSGASMTIDNDVVTNAKLANVSTATIKGRTTAGSGDPEDLTATQATALLDAMVGDSGAGGTKGLVPAPAAGDAAANKFLKANGTWAAPSGSGDVVGPASSVASEIVLFDGTTGKLIKSATTTGIIKASSGVISAAASGTDYVAPGSVTTDGITMNTARLLGRTTASAGAVEEITVGSGLSLSAGSLTATGGGGSITLGTPQTTTSGTAIDFTSIPAGVDRITVAFSGVSTSGTSAIIVQLGDSGGVENTGYLGAAYRNAYANYTTGFGISNANAAASVYHGLMIMTRMDGNTWAAGVFVGQSDTNYIGVGGGSKSLSAELDLVRITTVGGTDTFDAGTINIIYE